MHGRMRPCLAEWARRGQQFRALPAQRVHSMVCSDDHVPVHPMDAILWCLAVGGGVASMLPCNDYGSVFTSMGLRRVDGGQRVDVCARGIRDLLDTATDRQRSFHTAAHTAKW